MKNDLNPTKITDPNKFEKIVETLKNDGIIAYPTETVYGLGASIFSEKAIERLYQIKGRNSSKPVSVMVSNVGAACELCSDISMNAEKLMEKFWPGPLTIVFYASQKFKKSPLATKTVGIRFPDHEWSQKLVEKFRQPVTSTSANFSGKPPANSPADLDSELLAKLDLVVDGGVCDGRPSTVVDTTLAEIRILREGAIPKSEILKALNY